MATTPTNGKAILAKIISEFKDINRAEIKKWRQAIQLATDINTPRPYILQDMYDNLLSDGHLISQIGLRKAATLCSSFSIIDKKTGEPIPEKTELFQSEWFYNLMDAALDSILFGYTLQELVVPEKMQFDVIPRRNVVPRKSLVLFEASGDKGIDYSKGFERTLIHCGKKEDLGLMMHLCGLLIWKRNAMQAWAEFSEKFGMPLITATTNKVSKSDIANIEAMLRALGEAAQAVLPEGTTIDIKAFAGSDSFNVYDKQIQRINDEIAKPLTGGTMITDNGSSKSQSEVHERNLDAKIAVNDKRTFQFLVNDQLLLMMQSWGWDVNPETDKFVFDASFGLSVKEHWDVVAGVINYYDVDEKWISKTFNVPIIGVKKEPKPIVPPAKATLSENFR